MDVQPLTAGRAGTGPLLASPVVSDEPLPASTDGPDALVEAALARLGIDHELMPCDPALADTATFCEAYGIDPADSANTIVVVAKEDPPRYVACVLLATTKLDVNRVVRRRLAARKASFATAEETRALTGMEIGGVTAVGLPDALPVWVDAAVLGRQRIVLGGGSRRAKLVVDPAVLHRLPGVEVVEGLAVPIEPAAVAPAPVGEHA